MSNSNLFRLSGSGRRRRHRAFFTPAGVATKTSELLSTMPTKSPRCQRSSSRLARLPGGKYSTTSPNGGKSRRKSRPLQRRNGVRPSLPICHRLMTAAAYETSQGKIGCFAWISVPCRLATANFSDLATPLNSRTAFSARPLLCESPEGDSSAITVIPWAARSSRAACRFRATIAGSSSDFSTTCGWPRFATIRTNARAQYGCPMPLQGSTSPKTAFVKLSFTTRIGDGLSPSGQSSRFSRYP